MLSCRAVLSYGCQAEGTGLADAGEQPQAAESELGSTGRCLCTGILQEQACVACQSCTTRFLPQV